MRTIALTLLPLLALTAACGPRGGEDAALSCTDTRTALALDEASELGFSAAELLANVERIYAETLTWEDGATTGLTVEIDHTDGAVYHVDSEVEDTGDGTTDLAMPICEDRMEVEVTLRFVTEDGAFDETWAVTLQAGSADEASFHRELDVEALTGSYDFRALDPADYDEVTAWVYGLFGAEGSSGEVREQGTKVEGETASATNGQAGAWGGMEE